MNIVSLDTFLPSDTHWIESSGGLSLIRQGNKIDITASNIVRIQFKDLKEYDGVPIPMKPDKYFPNLKINRFPAKLILILKLPLSGIEKPILEIKLETGKQSWTLDFTPTRDQLMVDNQWFPLIEEDITGINNLLLDCEITILGYLSLRQCLKLIQSASEYLKVIDSEPIIETDSENSEHQLSAITTHLAELGFSAKLYPYQNTGVSWLQSIANEELGCILADEMGLGKTIQIIALITIFKSHWNLPTLIVAPATLLENWGREFDKFSRSLNLILHNGTHRSGFPSYLKTFDVIITSYDIATRDQSMLCIIDWGLIILDEAQAIKNPYTNRAIATKGFRRKVSIAVTGTPVENSLRDLWSIMDFACPGLLGSLELFETNNTDTETNALRVEQIVSPLMLRRLVADVAADLPDKIIIPQAVNISDLEIDKYEDLRNQIANEYGKSATLVSLTKLRQFCAHPFLLEATFTDDPTKFSNKYLRLVEILEEIVAQHQKAIIFTSYLEMSDIFLKDLSHRFGIPCYQIDGRTPVSDRQSILDIFSKINKSSFLILNPRAAGTGLNITAANHVIHYNLEWNPAVEDQATARAYRRGQTLPVTVHRLFYPNTIEEVINDRLDRKRNLAETAVVGTEASEADTADIARAMKISPYKQ